jgi:hypothetical protein
MGNFQLKKQEIKESDILNSICEYLALRKHFFFRTNNVPIWQANGNGGGFFRAMSKWSMKGVPDIIIVGKECGQFIGLECKSKTGKQSEDQREFQRRCEELSAEYYVVRSIEDCQMVGL